MKITKTPETEQVKLIGYVIKHQEYHGLYQLKGGMEATYSCPKCAKDVGD